MSTHGSIGKIDAIMRCVLSGTIILAVILIPTLPSWIAILATYPVFTVIVGIDPLYNAMGWTVESLRFYSHRPWRHGPAH